MSAKRVVALLLVALAGYFALLGYRGVYLVEQHSTRLKMLGAAVLALPLIGLWAVVAELRFGAATERLARRVDLATDAPLPRMPGGRVDRAAVRTAIERAA